MKRNYMGKWCMCDVRYISLYFDIIQYDAMQSFWGKCIKNIWNWIHNRVNIKWTAPNVTSTFNIQLWLVSRLHQLPAVPTCSWLTVHFCRFMKWCRENYNFLNFSVFSCWRISQMEKKNIKFVSEYFWIAPDSPFMFQNSFRIHIHTIWFVMFALWLKSSNKIIACIHASCFMVHACVLCINHRCNFFSSSKLARFLV